MASMAKSLEPLELHTGVEDVLAYLPISITTEYKKGQMIYDPDHPPQGIYLVVRGTVEVAWLGENDREVLMEIVRPDELFGESAFLDVPCRCELATAFENVTLMTWTISEMENIIMKRPRLAVAMLQVLAQRNAESARRIESLSIDKIETRLARALIHFSDRLGAPKEDGSHWMMPFTHVLLSRYIGTSREVITQHMNRFREQGYVHYSRQGIVLHRDGLNGLID
jgi:CRP/FNR family cyclic AMP-dependent transcriptional regulator